MPADSEKPGEPDEPKLGEVEYSFFHDQPAGQPAEEMTTKTTNYQSPATAQLAPPQDATSIEITGTGSSQTRPSGKKQAKQKTLKHHSFHGTRVAQALTGIALLLFITVPILFINKLAFVCVLVFIGVVAAVLATVQGNLE